MSADKCECGAPLIWTVSASTGERRQECDATLQRYRALYGEPTTFHVEPQAETVS